MTIVQLGGAVCSVGVFAGLCRRCCVCLKQAGPGRHRPAPAAQSQSAPGVCSSVIILNPSSDLSSLNMSWQSYVDDQLLSTKVIKNAVIAGHDGNIWATSAGFNVSFI